jgi:hypothetical protein
MFRTKNLIHHINVYQGKNASNAHIAEEAWTLPMTQKVVVNVMICSEINKGMRELHMDTRYTAPELFAHLREAY